MNVTNTPIGNSFTPRYCTKTRLLTFGNKQRGGFKEKTILIGEKAKEIITGESDFQENNRWS